MVFTSSHRKWMSELSKQCVPLISGGLRTFSWTQGMCLWNWWADGDLARTDSALHKWASSHLGGKAQAILHPSVSGRCFPERICAMSPEAEPREWEHKGQTGRRCRSSKRRDYSWWCRFSPWHGHCDRLQVFSKYFHWLHLHPGVMHTAYEVRTKVRHLRV